MFGPQHPTKVKYRSLSKALEKLLKVEEKCRKFYHQFVSKEKIEEWDRSFEAMQALLKRRKLENIRNSPDLRPDLIKKIKQQRSSNEVAFHSILVSLVRLGVNFDVVRKIDSAFESQLSVKELDELKTISIQVQQIMRQSPDAMASTLMRA